MKTFEEGDRVTHPTHGEGTVTSPHPGTGWTTVTFCTSDGLVAMMTDDSLLTPVPKTEPKFTLTVADEDGWSSAVGPFSKEQIDAVLTGGFNWDTVESITITRAKG